MTINFEKIEGFAADAKEFAVLVEDTGVAESISKHDFHDGRCKCCRRGVRNRFHAGEATHTTAADKVDL
jgi:hypothetical protein